MFLNSLIWCMIFNQTRQADKINSPKIRIELSPKYDVNKFFFVPSQIVVLNKNELHFLRAIYDVNSYLSLLLSKKQTIVGSL